MTKLTLEEGFERILSIYSKSSCLQNILSLDYCRNLQSIALLSLSSINNVWYDCYELTSIELPDLEDIACTYAVNCMCNLKSFKAPKLKRMSKATGVFKGDINLEEIDFPALTAIYGGNGYSFMTNVSLTAAYLPKLQ